MSYPYPAREVLVDALIHLVGLALGGVAAGLLIAHTAQTVPRALFAGVLVYLVFLMLGLGLSAAFHLLPWERPRDALQRLDHAAIYFKIAGTYTPIVVLMNSLFAYLVLTAVWLAALMGAWAKLRFWAADARGSLMLYLAMGWAAVLLVHPMWQTLPGPAIGLIAAGGALYTLGTLFYRARFPFQNAIWHGFVLGASACFFAAIALGVQASVP